jgi:hypothetical protein
VNTYKVPYKKNQWNPPMRKVKRRKKTHKFKPEENKDMPEHRHFPLANHHEDKHPKYHEAS